MDSGFRHVTPETYAPRLLRVVRSKSQTRVLQVALARASLNDGDAFVLDAGLKVYAWFGAASSAFEKTQAAQTVANIVSSRSGKASKAEPDDAFWAALGGPGPVAPAAAADAAAGAPVSAPRILLRLSDSSGAMSFTQVATGELTRSMLDASDVFVIDDGGVCVYVWIGSAASEAERRTALVQGVRYLQQAGRPKHLPVIRVSQGGREPAGFASCFT